MRNDPRRVRRQVTCDDSTVFGFGCTSGKSVTPTIDASGRRRTRRRLSVDAVPVDAVPVDAVPVDAVSDQPVDHDAADHDDTQHHDAA